MEGPDKVQMVEGDVENLNQGLRQRRTPDDSPDLTKEEEDSQNVTTTVGKRLSMSINSVAQSICFLNPDSAVDLLPHIISDLRMTIFGRI